MYWYYWLFVGVSCTSWAHLTIVLVSEDPKIHKQGTASKMKHTNLGISQKLEIIRNIENGVCDIKWKCEGPKDLVKDKHWESLS